MVCWEDAREQLIEIQSLAMREPDDRVLTIPVVGKMDVASTVVGVPCAGDVTLVTLLFW